MANSFTHLIPYIDKRILDVPFEQFAPLAMFDKDMEPAGGLTGRIPRTQATVVTGFTAVMYRDSGNSGTISGFHYTVDQVFEASYQMKYNEFLSLGSRVQEVVGAWVDEASRALLKSICSGFWASGVAGSAYLPGIPNIVGTPGTTPFAAEWDNLRDINIALARRNCPKDGRIGILDVNAYGALLNASGLFRQYAAGSTETLRNADVGRVLGVDFTLDTQVPTFSSSGVYDLEAAGSGAYYGSGTGSGADGDQIMDIYTSGEAATFAAGEILRFSGYTGYGQTHVVISGATTTTGGTGSVYIWPALSGQSVGTGTKIYGYGSGQAARRQNIVAHRSAYRLVMRDPRINGYPQDGEHYLIVEPRTRTPLEISFYPGDHMLTFAVRALWKWVPVRPEWACILAG